MAADRPEAGWFGDRAVMIRTTGSATTLAHVLASHLPGRGVRTGMDSVLVESDEPDPDLLGEVRRLVDRIGAPAAGSDRVGREVVVPVRYGGPDLSAVAAALGCTPADIAAAHARQAWRVAMMGFAPGFGYLVPTGDLALPWERLPRRESPRPSVPAGSVAVAAGMSAVYPSAMPGGWHLIGDTAAVLFDPMHDEDPTLLHPGDRVRFEWRS